ncbi:MAG TPA: hypothetical protein VHA56_08300 [Mucilaginibacter sp.]|nr:hypothetical protein [Mucilaginibacter sp.]
MKWYQSLNYPRWAIINFIVLSIFGVVLRYMQLYDVPKLDYQFILHAHSHFAFSGWMFFTIAFLIASLGTGDKLSNNFKRVLLLTLVSAYGMLASFSWQGYKPVSIGFSTLFVVVTFRFTYLVFHGNLLKKNVNEPAYILLRGSLLLLCLSALGPFALGPLAASGLKNSPYYQDAIYFYLHFQMNGFMLPTVLGLLAATLPVKPSGRRSRLWLYLFVFSAIPLYFIFMLWSRPGNGILILAFSGAALNLVSWLALCFSFRSQSRDLSFIERAAVIGLTFKCVFQLLVCIPVVSDWTFLNRNLIIGYIHLLTLGIIMPLLIGQLVRKGFITTGRRTITLSYTYVGLTVAYLALLFIQPLLALFDVAIPFYQQLLLCLCLLFLGFGAGLLTTATKMNNNKQL